MHLPILVIGLVPPSVSLAQEVGDILIQCLRAFSNEYRVYFTTWVTIRMESSCFLDEIILYTSCCSILYRFPHAIDPRTASYILRPIYHLGLALRPVP